MQTAVRTGRLSCRKPNIQQVPTEGAFGTNIRDSFRASSPEKCLFACDYSQNEIRILAHMSNDQALIGMFRSREEIDIYKQMSAAIRGIRIEDVTDDDRKISKQVTLGTFCCIVILILSQNKSSFGGLSHSFSFLHYLLCIILFLTFNNVYVKQFYTAWAFLKLLAHLVLVIRRLVSTWMHSTAASLV